MVGPFLTFKLPTLNRSCFQPPPWSVWFMGGAEAFSVETLFHMPFPGIQRACLVPPLALPPSQVSAWALQLPLVAFFIFTSFTPLTAGNPLVSVGISACLAPRICLRRSFLSLLLFEHQSSGSPSQCLSSTWLACFRPLCTVHPLAGWGNLQVQVLSSLLASQTVCSPLLLMHLHMAAGRAWGWKQSFHRVLFSSLTGLRSFPSIPLTWRQMLA